MKIYRIICRLVFAVVVCSWFTPASGQDLILREAIFRSPLRVNVQISPDGSAISYLQRLGPVYELLIQSVEKPLQAPSVVSTPQGELIESYAWSSDSKRLLLHLQLTPNDPVKLVAVNRDGSNEISLVPEGRDSARLIAVGQENPNAVLVATRNPDNYRDEVWQMSTFSGDGSLVLTREDDERAVHFLADDDLVIRGMALVAADGSRRAIVRELNSEDWYHLVRWGIDDIESCRLLGFSNDGRELYALDSRRTNTASLFAYRFDAEEDDDIYVELAGNKKADIIDVVFSSRTSRPVAVASESTHRDWDLLDASMKIDWNRIRSIQAGDLYIDSQSEDDMHWIVSFVLDQQPRRYYLFDRRTGEASSLFTSRDDLDSYDLRPMRTQVVTSRDGLLLTCYVTLPSDQTKPYPTVVLVHDGPWDRDHWGFDPWHQWLANRGYTVLSVNYRGSTGFGQHFQSAANQEWARGMQNDLVDAVNWGVSAGFVDPDRVAIVGSGYGGYAAMVGMTFTPQFYTAGVAISCPWHIRTFLQSLPADADARQAVYDHRIGGLDREDFLDSISPITKLNELVHPLLVIQGAQSLHVSEADESRALEMKQSLSLPLSYVRFPDEGTTITLPTNRLAVLALTEAFLNDMLGGRTEPYEDTLRNSSATFITTE